MAMQFMPPDFHHHHHHHHHIPPHPHTHAPPTPPNGKGSSNEPSSPQAPPLPPANLCHVWHPTTGQLIPLFNDAKDDVKKDKQRERKVIPILDPKTRTPVFVEPRKDVKPKQEESVEGKHTENKIEPTVETSLDIASIGLNLEEAMRKLKGNDSSSLNLNLYSLSLDEIAPPKKDSPKKPAPTPTPAPTSNQIEEEEEFPPEEDLPPPPTVSHAVQQTEDLDEVDENFSQGTKTPEPTKSPPLAPKDKAQPWRPKTEHHPPSNTKVDWADVEVEEEEAVAPTTTTRGASSWAQAARNSGGQQVSRRVLEQQQKATSSLLREKEERARKEREAKEKEDEEERQRKDQSDRFGRREPNQTGRAWGRGNNDREGGRPFAFGRDRGDREGSWNKGQGQFPSAPVRGSQTNSQTFPSRNGPSNQSSQPFRSAQQNSPSQNLRPNRPTPTPEVKPKPTPAQKIVVKEEDGWDVVISKKTIIENRKKGVEITVVKEKNDNSPPVPNGEFENRAKKTDDKTQKVKLNEEQLKPYRNKIRNLKKKLSDIDELKGKPDLNEDQLKKIKQENEIKKELEKAQSELNEYL